MIENLKVSSKIFDIEKSKLDKETSKKLTGYPQADKPWLKYYSEKSQNTPVPQKTIYQNIKDVCEKFKDNCAIEFFYKKLTYGQFLKKIDSIANSFTKLGVKQGDLVTLMMANTPEYIASIYALNKIGAVINSVDLRTSEEELVENLTNANSETVVATDMFLPNLTKIIEKTPAKKVIVTSAIEGLALPIRKLFNLKNKISKIPKEYMTWKQFEKIGKNMENVPEVPFLPNQAACITYTSGTTGKPKGVVLTNENFLAQVVQYQQSGIKFKQGEKFYDQVPPFLAFNCIMTTNLPLSLGLRLVVSPAYEPEKFAENIIKHKIDHAVAGPADWTSFLNSQTAKNADLSFLKTLASGSSHIDVTKKEKIDNFLASRGCQNKIIEGYGMSEAATAVCTNLPQCNINGSAGIPLPKTTMAVCNPETGEFLKYNEEGELCITGPEVMKEYFNNAEATDKVLKKHSDGKVYLHSGDLGYITEDGVVYVSGRIKRVIVSCYGFKISPLEIETIIMENPNVSDCCVVGVFDDVHEFGQIPVANVVLKDGIINEDAVAEEIKQLCREKIIEIHLPKKIKLVKELPLTKNGKVDYRTLTKECESNKAKQKIYSL